MILYVLFDLSAYAEASEPPEIPPTPTKLAVFVDGEQANWFRTHHPDANEHWVIETQGAVNW